ncbi:ABC transporter type 1, transmembrane domain-containing protein [Truncatella angustata]|uniref:ABC transporter type 1, transmembrane domain-containing protein n=1 Tax=Truncatella angustata TaxID=152316 RepID=A0A9P8ZVF5_9PEZI|nr:ABC transporter type 1, transmembrane domain-containing protein [Truncatella angustata]KAH6652560.1 ABC transporter type 1, transmembrane domain-containing protein [Truncatella angustata]
MTGEGLGSCGWPIWRIDDFTVCFQSDYLKILFPAVIIGLSLVNLVVQSILRRVKRSRASNYNQIPQHLDHTELPPEEEDSLSTDDDEEGLSIAQNGGGRLALVKTTTRGSIVQADTPPGQQISVVIEELAIVGLLAINIYALVAHAYLGRGQISALVGVVTWVYVLSLATLRLFLEHTKWRVPHVWNHTATIYACQWTFSLILFRSVLIHPSSQLAQILTIADFALTTLLFGMAMTTRKGNKTVLLEWEGEIEPSREPLASVFSLLTFGWVDDILWKGYKKTYEIGMVWNLLPKDKAASILSDYRQIKKTTSLALHLAKYFKGPLAVQAIWAVVSGVLTFIPTLLLKAILQYVEHPDDAPINVLWLYVILLPVADIIRSVADGQALWIGRKICIKIRAIIIGEIYAKALRRKAASAEKAAPGDSKNVKETRLQKLKKWVGLGKKKDTKNTDGGNTPKDTDNDPAKSADEQANLGTIINLMSVDSFKISEVTSYLHFLFAHAPSQLIVAIGLLWQVMGLSAIPGLVVMLFLLPVNILLAKGFHVTQKKIMAATDKRIHTTNEVLTNIRIIKYFAWEQRFSETVNDKRSAELKALQSRYMIWALAVAIWNTVPVLITFFSFLVYTKIEKKPLYPSIAFTAISLFMLLRVPLDQLGDMLAHVQEAKVSIDRVEDFLNEEETEKYKLLGPDNVDESGKKAIGFRDATFIWGNKDAVAEDGSVAFRLLDLNCDFKIGKLNVIAGPTGSGKTSLLMALLGEMSMQKGKVYLPGGRSREDVRADPETGLAETCAYVAQSAWLVNANIKENILFSAQYDEKRYRDVIIACALERDLEILDNGDETLVGEKGITLSGGQKQRISLARAVYSNSKHLLLDDCLSAVDSHTAQWIFDNCMQGPLMKDRTCILVTHNVTLCAPSSEYVVVLDNGRVSAQGSSLEVIGSGALGEELQNKSRPSSAHHVSTIPSRVPSSVGEESDETLVDNGGSETINGKPKDQKKEKKKADAMEETKATGAVKWSVVKLYLSAMGKWWFWVIVVVVFAGQQLSSVASNLWIREWANQYTIDDQSVSKIQFSTFSQTPISSTISPTYFASIATYVKDQQIFSPAEYSAASAPKEVNVDYYLFILAVIGIAGAFFALVRDLWLFFGSLTASKDLHKRLMGSVARAKFKFFDVTPLGQLMNRFSKDLEAIDQEVAPVAIGVMSCALAIVVTVVLIAAITPGFLIAGVFITGLYILVGMFYLRASRDLKRLESVHRSPLFQQFGETLSGVTTIRAYGDERRFIRENLTKINTQSRPFIYLWAANRWLAFRTDCLGDLVAFFAGVFVIFSIGHLDAGSAGLSLSYAIGFSDNILWLVRLYAMNEQNMNSVERVKEYLDIEQEAEPINEKNRPAKSWPAQGSVEFIGYSTRYREDLDPVLRDLTFKIKPYEKVGIVGRTGAGKSSLALALFRALEAEKGKILIDDVDIGQIGLRDLREAITIVPQDPTLFTGTLRTNLDPFDIYTDEDIFTALRRVQLIGPDENPVTPVTPTATRRTLPSDAEVQAGGVSTPTATNKNIFLDLSSPVAESGSNLSQGQRQLLCLARAMLKQPKVLIMDEATASIDYATDSQIQATIRDLKGTTITIAHRLATIVDYDKVLVLDHGEVKEFAHPWELLKKSDGIFKSMCETSGDFESLQKAAKKAFEAKRLVDDE